jgi:hypothetical protein
MRQNWGADHFPVIVIQPATIAAFALLEDLESFPECRAAFYNLCIVLRAASLRFRVNKGVLRLLDATAERRGIALPEGCAELLADFISSTTDLGEEKVWKVIDQLGLDYLLEKWQDLDLDQGS